MRTLLLLLLTTACHRVPDHAPTVSELDAMGDDEKAGRWLMSSPMGLLRLDAPQNPHDSAVIAVHGYESEGTEWVDPLATMSTWGTELYFYRWSWLQCPSSAARELDQALDALVAKEPSLQSLVVVAHSYGGLVTALMGQTQSAGRPTQLHLIAAPLSGVDLLEQTCPKDGLSAAPPMEGVRWHQWRTVHAADGAFKDMAEDPQIIDLPSLELTQLPAEWEGGRLGHNRAILWVTRELDVERASGAP